MKHFSSFIRSSEEFVCNKCHSFSFQTWFRNIRAVQPSISIYTNAMWLAYKLFAVLKETTSSLLHLISSVGNGSPNIAVKPLGVYTGF
jgi:hypothetical protein